MIKAVAPKENVASQLVMMSLARLARLAQEAQLNKSATAVSSAPQVLCIRPGSAGTTAAPLVLIHPIGGSIIPYRDLSTGFTPGRAVYGIQSQADENRSSLSHPNIDALAADYVDQLAKLKLGGSIVIGGYSLGGAVAFEMARQLLAAGTNVETVLLIDTPASIRRIKTDGDAPVTTEQLLIFGQVLSGRHGKNLQISSAELESLAPAMRIQRLMQRLRELKVIGEASGDSAYHAVYEMARHNEKLQRSFEPKRYTGHVSLVRTMQEAPEIRAESGDVYDDPSFGWQRYCTHPIAIKHVPGSHFQLLYPPFISGLAKAVQQFLDERGENQ